MTGLQTLVVTKSCRAYV